MAEDKVQKSLRNVIKYANKAVSAMVKVIDAESKSGTIVPDMGDHIAKLQKLVENLKTASIIADVNAGLSLKKAAGKYHLSEGTVSQIMTKFLKEGFPDSAGINDQGQ